jgi:hypothetical protein
VVHGSTQRRCWLVEAAAKSKVGQLIPNAEVKITGAQSQAARSAAFTPLHGSQGFVPSDNAATSGAEAA